MEPLSDITQILAEWDQGRPGALEKLAPVVYGELRQIAAAHMRHERSDHTLQPTALVHEAFLRLVSQRPVRWEGQAQFFGIAARLMRQILVNHARDRNTAKRGGRDLTLTLDASVDWAGARSVDLVALDDALTALAALDPQQSRVVELRFFGGLTVEEAAAVLGVSAPTVKREWRAARAWLHGQIKRRMKED